MTGGNMQTLLCGFKDTVQVWKYGKLIYDKKEAFKLKDGG